MEESAFTTAFPLEFDFHWAARTSLFPRNPQKDCEYGFQPWFQTVGFTPLRLAVLRVHWVFGESGWFGGGWAIPANKAAIRTAHLEMSRHPHDRPGPNSDKERQFWLPNRWHISTVIPLVPAEPREFNQYPGSLVEDPPLIDDQRHLRSLQKREFFP